MRRAQRGDMKKTEELSLRVSKAFIEDEGKGLARVDADQLQALGAVPGDCLRITGRRSTVARAGHLTMHYEGKDLLQIDSVTRDNAQISVDEICTVQKVPYKLADAIILSPVDARSQTPKEQEIPHILQLLSGLHVVIGDRVQIVLFGTRPQFFMVEGASPRGALRITAHTAITFQGADFAHEKAVRTSYEDIGGLEKELSHIREMIELPLKFPDLFTELGIDPPKGVLLSGPPGTGKTLIARAISNEVRAHFIHVNGPELIHKFYGESEAKLRDVFEEAARHAPAIIFIDEIDAVAPKRADVSGEVEKRVVAQLLSLMDGFVSRGQVIVIGATNIPEVLDPALRRPGRFDREIEIGVPNTQARLQILKIHSRAMPLGPDVDLQEIAEHSHGFVGADLEALCQEVGMITLRRFLASVRLSAFALPASDGPARAEGSGGKPDTTIDESADLAALRVTRDDWLAGLKEVEPSATREFFIEKSASTFASLGGLDDVKRLLDAVVEHGHVHDEIYEQVGLAPPRGILLVGPSGTGKTALARALSGEKQIPLIAIDGPQLYSKWLGESEKALREVFKKARRAAPCLLFFDTIDAIAPRLGGDHAGADVYQRILSQLLREIDNLRDVKGVILLAATNRPERVEPALLRSGRFDYIVRFAKPDAADRAAIVRLCCRRVPVAPDVDYVDLARRADGLTGADLETLCKKATLLAIAEFQSGARGRPFVVHQRHFLTVLESGPSLETAS